MISRPIDFGVSDLLLINILFSKDCFMFLELYNLLPLEPELISSFNTFTFLMGFISACNVKNLSLLLGQRGFSSPVPFRTCRPGYFPNLS